MTKLSEIGPKEEVTFERSIGAFYPVEAFKDLAEGDVVMLKDVQYKVSFNKQRRKNWRISGLDYMEHFAVLSPLSSNGKVQHIKENAFKYYELTRRCTSTVDPERGYKATVADKLADWCRDKGVLGRILTERNRNLPVTKLRRHLRGMEGTETIVPDAFRNNLRCAS